MSPLQEMAPARKKPKPNVDPQTEEQQPGPSQSPKPLQQQSVESRSKSPTLPTESHKASSPNAPASSRPGSWYNGGSWRAKSSPVAQIARENISVAKGATTEASEEPSRRPSQSVSKSVRGSRKSIPLAAEATRVHATSDASDKSRPRYTSEEKPKTTDGVSTTKEAKEPAIVEEPAPLPPEPPVVTLDQDAESVHSGEVNAAKLQTGGTPGWFGWWSRPDGYGSDGEKVKEEDSRSKAAPELASSTPLPGTPIVAPQAAGSATMAKVGSTLPATAGDVAKDLTPSTAAQWEGLHPEMSATNGVTRSWFGLWSSAQNQQAAEDAQVSE